MLYSPRVRPTSRSFQYARPTFGLRTSLPQTTRLAEGGAAADFGAFTRRRRRLARISTPRALSMKSTAPVSNARFSWAVKRITGKKHHRQVHAGLAQLDEQFDARYVWKVPVEKDDVSLTGDGESISQRYSIGKAMDDKPVIRQLICNDFATIRVVLDVEDPDEVPPHPGRFVLSFLRSLSSIWETFSAGTCSASKCCFVGSDRAPDSARWPGS